jgi:hypothetical protein
MTITPPAGAVWLACLLAVSVLVVPTQAEDKAAVEKAAIEKAADNQAATEQAARLARSPRQVAEQLAAVYGQKLDQVAYIPALPLVAKLRLSELTGDAAHREQVDRVVAPFLAGEKNPVPKSGSEQAGHLIFAELAARSEGKDRERWLELCRAAANQAFFKNGEPQPIVPFHNEMSDAVFMSGPILAATGKLTGERKYFRCRGDSLRGDAESVPSRGWHLSALAVVRSGLGTGQRLSGSGPRLGAFRMARGSSRPAGAAR